MMDTTIQTTVTDAGNTERQVIIDLLKAEKLPVDDLPNYLDNFFVAIENEKIIGAIGLEIYGDCGLLRSLVVDRKHRNKNIASALVGQLESHAKAKGLNCMYLLTETAAQYFEKKGYQTLTRDEVPDELKQSSEFSHVCPVSAVVMTKELKTQADILS